MPTYPQVPYDAQGNPLSVAPNVAMPQGQSYVPTAGSDYASPAKGQVIQCDSKGQQYAVPVAPSGVPVPVGVNATTPTHASAVGSISLAYSASNGAWVPFAVDPSGAGVVRQSISPTFSVSGTIGTGTTAGKSMMSFYNAGPSIQRLIALYAMCPPQINTQGGLLGIGSGTSYIQVLFSMLRMTGHAGGTLVPLLAHDMVDTADAGFTVRTGATVTGEMAGSLVGWDAAYDGTWNVIARQDPSSKVIKIWPGQGLSVKCLSALGANVNFIMRICVMQDPT